VTDGFELHDAELSSFVPGSRSRCRKGLCDFGAVSLPDLGGFKVLIQQNEQHGVPFFLEADSTDALTWLRAREKAAALDLEALIAVGRLADGVVSRLAGSGQLNAQETSCIVLRHFADAQRPAGEPRRYSIASCFASPSSMKSLSDLTDC
jgi:hypothetical protein